jgi:hypothetical protein
VQQAVSHADFVVCATDAESRVTDAKRALAPRGNAGTMSAGSHIVTSHCLPFVVPQEVRQPITVAEIAWDAQTSSFVKNTVTLAIFTTAALDGLATYPAYSHSMAMKLIDFACLLIFVVEMCIKLLAQGSKPWRFFIGIETLRADAWKSATSSWESAPIATKRVHDSFKVKETSVVATASERVKETEVHTVEKTTTTYVYHEFTDKEIATEADRFWNCFDFLIVGCCIFTTFSESDSSIGTLRLLRILRLIRAWDELRSIAQGLTSGLYASASIMFLFLFVIFLYSLVGVDLFRENDPFHFLNGEAAFYTLYGVSNMEWLDIANIQFYGCNDLKAGGFYMVYLNQSHPNYPKLDAELEVLDNYFDGIQAINRFPNVAYRLNEETGGWLPLKDAEDPFLPKELWCAPKQQLAVSVIYLTSYVCITGLILITLFTGAVAVAMTDSVAELAEEKKDKARALKKKQLQDSFNDDDEQGASAYDKCIRAVYSAVGFGDSCEHYPTPPPVMNNAYKLTDDRQSTANYKRMLCGLMSYSQKTKMISQQKLAYAIYHIRPDGPLPTEVYQMLKDERHLSSICFPKGKGLGIGGVLTASHDTLAENSSNSGIWIKFKCLLAELSMSMYELSNNRYFCLLVNATIMAAALVAGTDLFYPKVDLEQINEYLLLTMKIVFSAEFLAKLLAEGAHPLSYFNNAWNCFDAVILSITLMPSPNQALASLRALRLLKLIKSMSPEDAPQLHIVLAAFNEAVMSFQYVGALWILIIYIYAIIGFGMFGENDPKSFGTLHGAMWTLFGASTFDGVSDLMYTQIYGCDQYGAYIEYPFFNPDYYAAREDIAVHEMDANGKHGLRMLGAPSDNLNAMMMRELRGGKKKKKPKVGFDLGAPCVSTESGSAAFYYFLSYTTLSALILLSILLGVIQSGMENADKRNKQKLQREDQQNENIANRPASAKFLPLLCNIFDNFDPEETGSVPIDELVACLGGKREEMKAFKAELEVLDDDESGSLELTEFCEHILSKHFGKAYAGGQLQTVSDGSML